MSNDPVQDVKDAWTEAGPVPLYHEAKQDQLRREWPTLAESLERLTGTTDQ